MIERTVLITGAPRSGTTPLGQLVTMLPGAVDLYEFDPRNLRAGVGIVIDESKRKQGHALVGLNLLSEYAFNHLGVHQLYAEVPTSHDPSVRLFEKAGYLTGEIRKNWVRKGSLWLDVNLMQKFSES